MEPSAAGAAAARRVYSAGGADRSHSSADPARARQGARRMARRRSVDAADDLCERVVAQSAGPGAPRSDPGVPEGPGCARAVARARDHRKYHHVATGTFDRDADAVTQYGRAA